MSSRRDEEFCTTSEQNNICRLCGQCTSDIIAIFSDEAHRKHVLLKIQTRLLIQISACDPLPKNACNDCLEKLDSLWDFFELCRKTQITLREKFLNQRRGEGFTLREQTIDHQASIGTSHPPCCSLKSIITHQTTQDILDGAPENKKIKLENVPLIKSLKEELVCLDENSHTDLASTVTSSAGCQESYSTDNREVGAESSKISNISARSDHQQGSDNIVNKLCVTEMVDAVVRRSMTVLKNCDMGEVRSSICLSVKKSNHQKAASSGLKDKSPGQQQGLQHVPKTKPVINKQASVDCINSSAVHENTNRSSPVISISYSESDENMLSHRRYSLLARTRTEGGRHSPVVSFASDSDTQSDVSLTGAENSVVQQMEENVSRNTLLCGKNQEAVQQITANSFTSSSENICQAGILSGNSTANHVQVEKNECNMLGSLLCIRENLEKERRDTLQKQDTDTHATKSVTQEGTKCVVLEEKDHILASSNTGGLSVNPGTCRVQMEEDENSMLGSSVCIRENLEEESRDTLQKKDADNHATKSVTQEGTKSITLEEKDQISASSNAGGLSGNSGASHIQKEKDENNVLGSSLLIHGNLEKEKRETIQKEDTDTHATKSVTQEGPMEKDENSVLRSSLLIHGNLEKEKRETIQKEDTDTHATKSVTQEGIKCTIQEEKDQISASSNTVSLSDTVNSCGKLHGDDDGVGGRDDDHDSIDCDNSFTSHDCGNNFSLTDHIFKQHMPAGQTNTLHAAPPTIVALKCSDSSINKLSPSDVGSVHSANTSDSVLQKMETVSNSVESQEKPVEAAQASNCKVRSVDDDIVLVHDSTSKNASCVKPLETELKPTTIEEAILMCEKYSKRICETSGEYPKIDMINIKVELTSGDLYTNTNYSYRKLFKPFIILQDSRYYCQICKETLNTRSAIVKHIGKHFNLFPYSCNICGKRYTILQHANEHIKLHLTKFICEQCGTVCCSSLAYIKHMRGHEKPYTCHDCGGRFRSKAAVRAHIWKEHMNIRSYVCQLCGKAYFHPGNVATHMIFAHADKKIVCQYCGKMYYRNNMLKQHIIRWHS